MSCQDSVKCSTLFPLLQTCKMCVLEVHGKVFHTLLTFFARIRIMPPLASLRRSKYPTSTQDPYHAALGQCNIQPFSTLYQIRPTTLMVRLHAFFHLAPGDTYA